MTRPSTSRTRTDYPYPIRSIRLIRLFFCENAGTGNLREYSSPLNHLTPGEIERALVVRA